MKRPRTQEEADLRATLLVNQNVEPPSSRPTSTAGIGPSELLFVAGFLMAAAGLAMIWLPLGVIFAGVTFAFLAWKTA
jgi:anti-sigma factor RsiW